jgi:hypothetical protein
MDRRYAPTEVADERVDLQTCNGKGARADLAAGQLDAVRHRPHPQRPNLRSARPCRHPVLRLWSPRALGAARRLTKASTDLEAVADLHALNDGPPNEARGQLIDLLDAAAAEC